ncbi:MAG: YicC family protein [Thermoanaerobacteraceae bacterium]|nr:YicC family protein [Thermoanaerobacteraceae bacterium]
MLKSMTGFGRGEASGQGKRFTVELKAVNHRFGEIFLRLPRNMVSLEDRIRRVIQSRIARGRVDGYISMEECAEKSQVVKVDKGLAASYYKALEELQSILGLKGAITLEHLTGLPGVLVLEEPEEEVEKWWPVIQEALDGALEGLLAMRRSEGARLRADMDGRLDRIALILKQIEDRAPRVVAEYHQRLTQRLAEWMPGTTLDESRLAMEVAIFAERSSITEEVVRLYSHLAQFRGFMDVTEPVGRKLDFLLQEMHREINTIASKAGDQEISRAVVEMKSELEKIREQVQNIE